MKAIYCAAVSLAFAACTQSSNRQDKRGATDTIAKVVASGTSSANRSDQCYQHLEGAQNQDTTVLHLIIEGNTAKGELNWQPAEKDARKGLFKGTVDGDIIKGMWVFMQEGMSDSMPVEFKIEGDKIMRKTYEYDQSTGKQFIGANSKFEEVFEPVECEN